MEDLHIEATKRSPEVSFHSSGHLLIRGRSVMEDPTLFFDSILVWVYEYIQDPAENTIFDIALEYFNSGSSRAVLQILRDLTQVKNLKKSFLINWYYEEGDDDILERGQYYSSLLRIPFNLIQIE